MSAQANKIKAVVPLWVVVLVWSAIPFASYSQDPASDDFERATLGSDWAVIFPTSGNQVQIIDNSDLGMVPGPQGFFLINWRGSSFGPDQFCEAVIPADVTSGWAHQPYVRWRAGDGARYGFGYDNDPNQVEYYQKWYFKYDGVPSAQTRMMALADGPAPVPGDTLRVEVSGYTLYGYHNGNLVLTYTDTDPNRIADGETGLAARWANGNQQTNQDAKVWESWRGGMLSTGPRPPSAVDQFITLSGNSDTALVLSGTDPDGDSLSYEVLTLPANGSLTGGPPNLVYTPASGFLGRDSLLFAVTDGQFSDTGAVRIDVIDDNVSTTVNRHASQWKQHLYFKAEAPYFDVLGRRVTGLNHNDPKMILNPYIMSPQN